MSLWHIAYNDKCQLVANFRLNVINFIFSHHSPHSRRILTRVHVLFNLPHEVKQSKGVSFFWSPHSRCFPRLIARFALHRNAKRENSSAVWCNSVSIFSLCNFLPQLPLAALRNWFLFFFLWKRFPFSPFLFNPLAPPSSTVTPQKRKVLFPRKMFFFLCRGRLHLLCNRLDSNGWFNSR